MRPNLACGAEELSMDAHQPGWPVSARRGDEARRHGPTYLVTVAPTGSSYLVRVPAFGLVMYLDDESRIGDEAVRRIGVCGAAGKDFHVEIQRLPKRGTADLRVVE
ncbi:MAG: hypothetical protein HOQ36_14565 [Nocardia sp.]|nr:hypothetical protein [Nocardia sp.]NUS93604.1 hypothetical protein [Nocardia sp.]